MNTWQNSPEYMLVSLMGGRLGQPVSPVLAVDWPGLLALARLTRTAPLVQQAIAGRTDVPEPVRHELMQLSQQSFVATTTAAQALPGIAAALANVPWVLLRGPALGARLYGDLALRPYGDLDVLVAPEEVDAALTALRQAGFAPPPAALDEKYYRRYHLHIELLRPGPPIASHLELHWALDHPFTLLTINPSDIVRRSQPIVVERQTVAVPELNDLLLTLSIHLVKHMVQLPAQLEAGQLAGIVNSGFMLQLFDIALVLYTGRDTLDWEALRLRAAAWGAAGSLRLSLEAVDVLWPGLTTAEQRVLFDLPTQRKLEQAVLKTVSASAYGLRKDMFFRPVRLLDSLTFIFPPDDFLQRRYQTANALIRLRHVVSSIVRLAQAGVVLGYYLLAKRFSRSRLGGDT